MRQIAKFPNWSSSREQHIANRAGTVASRPPPRLDRASSVRPIVLVLKTNFRSGLVVLRQVRLTRGAAPVGRYRSTPVRCSWSSRRLPPRCSVHDTRALTHRQQTATPRALSGHTVAVQPAQHAAAGAGGGWLARRRPRLSAVRPASPSTATGTRARIRPHRTTTEIRPVHAKNATSKTERNKKIMFTKQCVFTVENWRRRMYDNTGAHARRWRISTTVLLTVCFVSTDQPPRRADPHLTVRLPAPAGPVPVPSSGTHLRVVERRAAAAAAAVVPLPGPGPGAGAVMFPAASLPGAALVPRVVAVAVAGLALLPRPAPVAGALLAAALPACRL